MHFGAALVCLGLPLALATPASAASKPHSHIATGTASWYGAREAGRRMAGGAIFDPKLFSAAHRTLRFGSCVLVTRLQTKQSLTVPILDRRPYVGAPLIDLSQAAAAALGIEKIGLARVSIRAVPCGVLKEARKQIDSQQGENS
jgi:rare lipoprotein A